MLSNFQLLTSSPNRHNDHNYDHNYDNLIHTKFTLPAFNANAMIDVTIFESAGHWFLVNDKTESISALVESFDDDGAFCHDGTAGWLATKMLRKF